MHHSKKQDNKAVIIGSGIGGLASAIRLAVKGFEVSVYERNEYPGGKLNWFKLEDYCFDAGPSLFTEPHLIEELFLLANEPIEDYFNYKAVDITCNYFFENGKKVEATSDAESFALHMQERLGEPAENVKRYLKNSADAYHNIGSLFLKHSLHRLSDILSPAILKAIGSTKFSYLFHSLNKHNQAAFITPEAVQVFNRFATYNGSNPYKAPAMLSLIPNLELNDGVFYPYGGMISITNALFKLAEKKGVKFQFSTPVERIIHQQGHVKGVVVNSQNIYAPIVVSNCDVYFTYKNLLNDARKSKDLLKQERSSSAFVFYWGISKPFPQLGLHNIFFSKDYKTEFEFLFNKRQLFDDPTVYINITSKMETGQAPEGKENWFVMINAPANYGQDWQELQNSARQNILSKLNRLLQTDIEPLIETEDVLNPVTIEQRTMSYMGSLYGTSSNSKMSAFLRHPNFSTEIKGM
jgi:phytoene desaturase